MPSRWCSNYCADIWNLLQGTRILNVKNGTKISYNLSLETRRFHMLEGLTWRFIWHEDEVSMHERQRDSFEPSLRRLCDLMEGSGCDDFQRLLGPNGRIMVCETLSLARWSHGTRGLASKMV
jgi:hypothetical protein